jgi:hypothetical protein
MKFYSYTTLKYLTWASWGIMGIAAIFIFNQSHLILDILKELCK